MFLPSVLHIAGWARRKSTCYALSTVLRKLVPLLHSQASNYTTSEILSWTPLYRWGNWGPKKGSSLANTAFDFTWIQVVQMPGVGGRRHRWEGEWGSPTVGLHQFTLDVNVSWDVGLSQSCFEGGYLVELDSREAPSESRGVVLVNLLVNLPCFWKKRERK